MAEGDTIKRAQLRLEPVLKGGVVEEFWAKRLRGHKPRAGLTVTAVRSVGKHLLIDFDNGLTLDTHCGMDGYWRAHPGSSREMTIDQRYDPYLKLILATKTGYALCYKAPTIQTYLTNEAVTPVTKLGPDLCQSDFDLAEVLIRVRKLDQQSLLIEMLMDQTVACGIGNIFKSEALHIEKLNPFATVGSLSNERLERLYIKAAKLLQRNARSGNQSRSITRLPDRFFVYKRFRAPCKRCDTPISRSYEGKDSRSTYWCPKCQPQ